MLVSRIAIATAALVIGSAYALFAQPAPKPQPIGMLLAAGDISTCDKDNPLEWKKYAGKTAGVIREAIKQAEDATPKLPYRVIPLGDLAYGTGTAEEFKCFGERWPFKNEALLPVPGNHEYLNKDETKGKNKGKKTDAGPYFEHFKDHPLVTQNGPKKGYYALNFPQDNGPWRLIGLNDNFASAPKYKEELKTQTAWLEKDLADNKQNCVLAFWHAPTFSSGRHGHVDYTQPKKDAALSEHRAMQKTFGILYRHGASVVLAGHEHSYEQFKTQDENGKAASDGIRLFVIGTGGAELTEDFYTENEANSEGGAYGRDRGSQGVLKILLYKDRYEWEFLSIEREFKKKVGKKTVTTTEKRKLNLATTSADCNKRK